MELGSEDSHRTCPKGYTAYAAVLRWMLSTEIKFAPLASTFAWPKPVAKETDTITIPHSPERSDMQQPPVDDPPKSRSTYIRKKLHAIARGSYKAPSASPKSVYALSHLLEIDDLKKLALREIRRQLTPYNVAAELYSPMSAAYEEVRQIELDYAVQNWGVVGTSPAIRAVHAKARATPGFASTYMTVNEEVMERTALSLAKR